MRFKFYFVYIAAFCSCFFALSKAQALPGERGTTFRVCTQNLFRFGDVSESRRQDRAELQLEFLVTRFKRARCDVIAAQEVFGSNAQQALKTLEKLSTVLNERTGRAFAAYVGEGDDKFIRNGVLVAKDVAEVVEVKRYENEYLPRLQRRGPSGHFIRAPLGIHLRVKRADIPGEIKFDKSVQTVTPPRDFFILNIHSKSKSKGFTDHSGTGYEALRMEMAEGFRSIFEKERTNLPDDAVMVLVGDRNSGVTSASAKILSGTLRLDDFRENGKCELDEKQVVSCNGRPESKPYLLGLFAYRTVKWPGQYRGGSYSYRGREELIDEVAILPNQLPLVEREGGTLAIGLEGQFYKGSDHKLLYAEFSF